MLVHGAAAAIDKCRSTRKFLSRNKEFSLDNFLWNNFLGKELFFDSTGKSNRLWTHAEMHDGFACDNSLSACKHAWEQNVLLVCLFSTCGSQLLFLLLTISASLAANCGAQKSSTIMVFFKLEQFWCQSHRAILLELRGVNKDYITDIKTTQDFKVYQLFLSNASKTCAINV